MSTKTVIIRREDFDGNKDSEGREYFDYILNSLFVKDEKKKEINQVDLEVSSFTVSE